MKMSHQEAASVVALRRLVENLIIQVSNNPLFMMEVPPDFFNVLSLIRMLSRSDAGNFQVSNTPTSSKQPPQGNMYGRGRYSIHSSSTNGKASVKNL